MIITAGILGSLGSLNPVTSLASDAAGSLAGIGLHAISAWVLNGTKQALRAVAGVIGAATAPNLDGAWFSTVYWRVAALAAMLTLPFLFAAAIQALLRSDLALLTRAAFGYLPLSLVAVGLAAPVTMLLLAATDEMSNAVAAVGTEGGAQLIDRAAVAAGAFSASNGSVFFAVIIGIVALLAAIGLMLELLMREAAVYVVVLMLPLAFAAMVWPARRIWAARMVEILVSLILSKFVIVAVLSLAGAAFTNGIPGISVMLVAMALIVLALFSPWALMRLLPFAEIGAGAASMLHREAHQGVARRIDQAGTALGVDDQAAFLAQRLRQLGRGGMGDGEGRQQQGFAQQRTPQSFASADGSAPGTGSTDGHASVAVDTPAGDTTAVAGADPQPPATEPAGTQPGSEPGGPPAPAWRQASTGMGAVPGLDSNPSPDPTTPRRSTASGRTFSSDLEAARAGDPARAGGPAWAGDSAGGELEPNPAPGSGSPSGLSRDAPKPGGPTASGPSAGSPKIGASSTDADPRPPLDPFWTAADGAWGQVDLPNLHRTGVRFTPPGGDVPISSFNDPAISIDDPDGNVEDPAGGGDRRSDGEAPR